MSIDLAILKKWGGKTWQITRNNFESLLRRLSHRPEKVRWVTWEITNACNSKCLLCDIWKTPRNEPILTLTEIKRSFSDPLFKDLDCVLITGGEPVLRPDLAEIILFIHQQIPEARFTLSTNGILPDRVLTVVKQALENGVSLDVGVSLDGIGEQHDLIRGIPGNYAKVDYLLKALIELRKKYTDRLGLVVGLTLHPRTVANVRSVQEYANNLGVHFIVQLYDEAPYYHNIGKLGAVETLTEGTKKMMAEIDRLPPSLHNLIARQILEDQRIKFRCYAMRSFFLLRANGDVMPCLRFSDMKIGNIKEKSPSEIWSSSKSQAIRRQVETCAGCGNTWATDWSLYNDVFPFLGLIGRFIGKKLTTK